MKRKQKNSIQLIAAGMLILNISTLYSDSPSTWTGASSVRIDRNANWDNGVPFDGIAIFNGNGENNPLANQSGGTSFSEIQFTSSTEISVITRIQTTDPAGITSNPGVIAQFNIYEHQPAEFPPAVVTIDSGGSPGDGGGSVLYNLSSYGQLITYAGSTDQTIINITMTGGHNYFELNGMGANIFDNVSSDDETDEIYIQSGANLTIRGSNTNTIIGIISGDGSLTKTGSGSLILTNNNTYSGDTIIEGGFLTINGAIASNVTVNQGGSLRGAGSIDGNVTVAGVISPGNSIGTLTVVNYTSTSSSLFSCEITSSGASDKIVATGAATIDGTIEVIPLDLSFTAPQTYVIVQGAGGIFGTFAQKQSSVPGLIQISYGANAISLTYLPLATIGLHPNELAAATCFVSLSGNDPNIISSELLTLSFSEMKTAFNQMQPSQFSAETWTQLANTILVRSSYSTHLKEFSLRRNCSDTYHIDLWIDALGQWEHQHQKEYQFGYNDWTSGFSIGADSGYKQFRFGGAASYTYSGVNWNQVGGDAHISGYYGGLYGGWSNDIGYVIVSTLGAYSYYNSTREISIGNITRQAHATHHGWEVLAGIEGGADFDATYCTIGPFARFDYIYLWQNEYQERGANSLNLHIDSREDQLIQSQIGIAFARKYECRSDRGSFTPRVELSYIRQSPIGTSDYVASFQGSNCEYSVSGWNFERNLGAVAASLRYLSPNEKYGLLIQYDGQFGVGYTKQIGNLIFNIKY